MSKTFWPTSWIENGNVEHLVQNANVITMTFSDRKRHSARMREGLKNAWEIIDIVVVILIVVLYTWVDLYTSDLKLNADMTCTHERGLMWMCKMIKRSDIARFLASFKWQVEKLTILEFAKTMMNTNLSFSSAVFGTLMAFQFWIPKNLKVSNSDNLPNHVFG